MKILILAEHDNKTLKPAIYHLVTAALELGHAYDVLVVGYQCQSVAAEAALLTGVENVLIADSVVYEHQLAENLAVLIAETAQTFDYVLSPASTFGKNILPRVAALMDLSMVSDIVKIESPDTYVRPIYAGNALATVQSSEKIKILSVRTTAFSATNQQRASAAAISTIDKVIENTSSRFESQQLTQSTRPELTTARVVISGGRGLKSADNFHLLEDIADKLGAAVGASRAAVDAGFAPNDYQVGQTGKVVAPDLYIAVGISGAIQHLAGMKDSKVIVAINSDPEAPIFQIADYGLVGDLFKILPELSTALSDKQ